ncbi:MAG TPA: hypothetical protein VFD75_20180 [Pyrinomonadaceae bacterium]|nr:hypothetical protein [Pyrinomonadaceae bacterium]
MPPPFFVINAAMFKKTRKGTDNDAADEFGSDNSRTQHSLGGGHYAKSS